MTVVKVTELVASSPTSWQDAVEKGLQRASKTVRNIRGVDVTGWKGKVENEKIVEYRVILKIAFGIEGE